VQIGGSSADTVKELSLFWTELVTDDKVQVIVPKSGVWGQPLRNFSIYPAPPHAGEIRFQIPEDTDLDPEIERVHRLVSPTRACSPPLPRACCSTAQPATRSRSWLVSTPPTTWQLSSKAT